MTALTEGDRDREGPSPVGGVKPRWLILDCDARHTRLKRTVDHELARQRDKARKAFKTLCAQTLVGDPDAWQALAPCKETLTLSRLEGDAMARASPDKGRGRPHKGETPEWTADVMEGALASSGVRRQALWEQQSGVVLATHDLDDQARSAQEVLTADKGPRDAERGFRVLKDPPCLASSLDLKKPERMRARWMGMTVGGVDAALEYPSSGLERA